MSFKNIVMLVLLASTGLYAGVQQAIVGDYMEVRSNEVYTCGCLFSGQQVTAGREAILAWDIKDGSFHGEPLAGVKVVAVVAGNRTLSVETTPRKSVLYLDGIASDGQQQAVVDLFARNYANAVGEIVALHRTAISFQLGDGTARLTVGEVARLEIRTARLPDDAHPGSYQWYKPFVELADATLGTTLDYEYRGADFAHQWWDGEPAISAYMGSFRLAV